MSRTFRSIKPFWKYRFHVWSEHYSEKEVKQHRQFNGYDGCNHSYIYHGHLNNSWREAYVGNAKRFFKKLYHKQRRKNWDRFLIREGLNYDPGSKD